MSKHCTTYEIPCEQCACEKHLVELDRHRNSFTLQCTSCQRCFIYIERDQIVISLRDFHQKRGEGKRPFDDLEMALELHRFLLRDSWPSPAIVCDFGIDSQRHLRALQHAVRHGVTAYELDRVMGDGPAITTLVRSVHHQPYGSIKFTTAWDGVDWTDVWDDDA